MESRASKVQELVRLLKEASAAGESVTILVLSKDLDQLHDELKAERKTLDKIIEIIEGKKKGSEVNGNETVDEQNGNEDGLMVEVVQDVEDLVQPLVNEPNKIKIKNNNRNNTGLPEEYRHQTDLDT